MSEWRLTYEGFDPKDEGLREALCTLGNGYFATRGAGPEAQADEIHYPGTYLAGGYNRLETEIEGRVIENEDLVNLPNWLLLNFRIGRRGLVLPGEGEDSGLPGRNWMLYKASCTGLFGSGILRDGKPS